MKRISYTGYRFPPEIIQRAIWLYLRFTLSLRDVEDLLAERGISVSYESIRRWIIHNVTRPPTLLYSVAPGLGGFGYIEAFKGTTLHWPGGRVVDGAEQVQLRPGALRDGEWDALAQKYFHEIIGIGLARIAELDDPGARFHQAAQDRALPDDAGVVARVGCGRHRGRPMT